MDNSLILQQIPVYWIGGSPCSGKSTIAAALVEKQRFTFYDCDEAYYRHLTIGDPVLQPRLYHASRATPEEVWLGRSVAQQTSDELALYREEFPFILNDIGGLPGERPVIAEGAALLPELLAALGIARDRAIWIIPTEDFQREHYARREWRHDVVKNCSDPELAWENWMARDAAFAREVAAQATALGFELITVDGSLSIAQTICRVEGHFGLSA